MKKLIPFAIAVVLIIVVAVCWVLPEFKGKYTYSTEEVDLYEYYEIYANEEVLVTLQNDLIPERARVFDEKVYVDIKMVETYFTDRFYYNETEQVLLYSTPTDIITVKVGDESTAYYVNDMATTTGYKIAFIKDNTLYVALDYVKRYSDFAYELFESPYRLQIYTQEAEAELADIKKDTQVRTLGGVKCPILAHLKEGDIVTVLNKMDTWTEVKTRDAIKGYVETKYLTNERSAANKIPKESVDIEYPDLSKDYTVAIAWHYVGSQGANENLSALVSNAQGLNTVSPTWFYLKDNEGNILDLGSASYVQKAHEKGLEVWALIEDITYDVDLEILLSSSAKRTKLINNLMDAASRYKLDGINIDFEGVKKAAAKHFVQFLRELSIKTHEAGIVLSVDNYMPNAGNLYYNYAEQGRVADYVILMGYDEHWAGCSTAGSVASLPFEKNGIRAVLDMGVPASKIINAIPFYTRIWETVNDKVKDTTDSMVNAKRWVEVKGIDLSWDEETGQYYGELTSNNTFYQIWMEDEESINAKLNMMLSYNLGGVGAWRLGYEPATVWPLIKAYVMTNSINK